MTAYEVAREELAKLNARFWAVKKRSEVASMEDVAEWNSITEERFAIRDAAKAAGAGRADRGYPAVDHQGHRPQPEGDPQHARSDHRGVRAGAVFHHGNRRPLSGHRKGQVRRRGNPRQGR